MVMWKVHRLIFNILCWTYLIGPFIAIPWWAYHCGNWWLLLGILASYVGCFSAGKLVAPSLVFMILVWWFNGFSIYQWATYLWLCATFGGVMFLLADAYQEASMRAFADAHAARPDDSSS